MERYDEHGLSDGYKLSTGKVFYANNGIIGLCLPDGEEWSIHEGYDGGVWYTGQSEFTKAELAEIADFMIELWREFKTEVCRGA